MLDDGQTNDLDHEDKLAMMHEESGTPRTDNEDQSCSADADSAYMQMRDHARRLEKVINERNGMDKLERDTEPDNGWTIKFATLKALREQAREIGENPSEEEVEAVALAMVDLGYALIEMPIKQENNNGMESKSKGG